MNIFKHMSEEERRRYGTMSKREREEFRKNKEKWEESGRTVQEDELAVSNMKGADSGKQEKEELKAEEKRRNIFAEVLPEAGREKENSDKSGESVRNLIQTRVDGPEGKGAQREQEHECIYIAFIVDATYSFSQVFPAVYHVLVRFMNEMKIKKREFPQIKIKYGMVMFHEKIQETSYAGEYFTEKEEVFLERLRKMRLTGGSEDGYEETINEAIKAGIRILENSSEEYANRGIVLLTDSFPRDTSPDFRYVEGCENRGLRFALCYLYDDEYMPMFKITDRDGDVVENRKNKGAEICVLNRLFGSEGMEMMQKQIGDIMHRSSVY